MAVLGDKHEQAALPISSGGSELFSPQRRFIEHGDERAMGRNTSERLASQNAARKISSINGVQSPLFYFLALYFAPDVLDS